MAVLAAHSLARVAEASRTSFGFIGQKFVTAAPGIKKETVLRDRLLNSVAMGVIAAAAVAQLLLRLAHKRQLKVQRLQSPR